MADASTIWNFPTTHGVKAIGLAINPIQDILLEILRRQGLNHKSETFGTKLSANGKYISITIEVHLSSIEQVQTLYGALHAHPLILQSL